MNILNNLLNTRSSKSLVGDDISTADFISAKKVLFSMFSRYGDFFATLKVIQEFEKQYGDKELFFIVPPQMGPYIKYFFPNAKLITLNKRNPIALLFAIVKLKKYNIDIGLNPWSHGADSEFFISFAKKFMFYKKEMKKYNTENLYDKPRSYLKLNLLRWAHEQPVLEKHYEHIIICPESSDIEKSISHENIQYLLKNISVFSPNKVTVAATKRYFDTFKGIFHYDFERVYLKRGSLASLSFLQKVRDSDLMLTADSGPLHLAHILDKDAIAYFSKTVPEWVLDSMSKVYVQRDSRMHNKYCQYADNGMCRSMECMNANFRDVFLKEYVHSDLTKIQRENYCIVEA